MVVVLIVALIIIVVVVVIVDALVLIWVILVDHVLGIWRQVIQFVFIVFLCVHVFVVIFRFLVVLVILGFLVVFVILLVPVILLLILLCSLGIFLFCMRLLNIHCNQPNKTNSRSTLNPDSRTGVGAAEISGGHQQMIRPWPISVPQPQPLTCFIEVFRFLILASIIVFIIICFDIFVWFLFFSHFIARVRGFISIVERVFQGNYHSLQG
mmetsp:Transcript_7993/g.35439  ORF Transcript_7993/g.35439 Transcript_7993/m.35439 type:complete len:210 (+) Transcript_7993:4036-4665(+)